MKPDTKTKTTVELLFAFIDSIPDAEERVKTAAVESALSFVWRAWGWNPDRWQEERAKAVRTQKEI